MAKKDNISKIARPLIALLLAIILLVTPLVMVKCVHKEEGIPIIVYHRVVSHDMKTQHFQDDQWVHDVEDFEEQMKYLYDNGYKTLSMEEFYNWYKGKVDYDENKTVVITFDDGYVEYYYLVLPILKKYNLKATVFVIGDKTEPSVIWDENSYKGQFLSQELIDHMRVEYPNFEIQSHTYWLHQEDENGIKYVYKTSEEELRQDFQKMKNFNTGYLAYPYGAYTHDIQKIAKEQNMKMCFTFRNYRRATRQDNQWAVERIKIGGNYDLNKFKKELNN